jgi:hypothetical protein
VKIFLTVFSAILAAALIIIVGLYGWSRLAQWQRAQRMCYAQISSEVDSMSVRTSRDQSEMHELATRAQDSSDVLEVGRRGVASLQALEESQNRVIEIEHTLIALLENKPFGLSLATDERKELDSARADVQKHSKAK